MKKTGHWTRLLSLCVVAAGLSAAAAVSTVRAQELDLGQYETAFTKPMFESAHSFDQIGIVKEVPVEVGDHVKKGDTLVVLDDRVVKAELERLEVEANSTLRVEAAKAELAVSRVQLKNKQQMGEAASPLEIQEAELNVVVGEIKVKVEEEALRIAKIKAEQQRILLGKMKMVSELDGIVAKVEVGVGEVVDPDRPAITVVTNDPLRVALFLPAEKATMLKPGEVLQLRYNDKDSWKDVKVRFVAPVSYADSGQHLVELELPNDENRAAGLHLQVKLPDRLLGEHAADGAAAAAVEGE